MLRSIFSLISGRSITGVLFIFPFEFILSLMYFLWSIEKIVVRYVKGIRPPLRKSRQFCYFCTRLFAVHIFLLVVLSKLDRMIVLEMHALPINGRVSVHNVKLK